MVLSGKLLQETMTVSKALTKKEFNKGVIYRDTGGIKGIYKGWWASKMQRRWKAVTIFRPDGEKGKEECA